MSQPLKDTVGRNRRHLPRMPYCLVLHRPTAKKDPHPAMRRQPKNSAPHHRHLPRLLHLLLPRRPTTENVQQSGND